MDAFLVHIVFLKKTLERGATGLWYVLDVVFVVIVVVVVIFVVVVVRS